MGGPMSVFPQVQPAPDPAPAPPPTLIETIGLEYGRGGVAPDWGRNQVNAEGKLQDQIRQALRQRGYPVEDYILGYAREERSRRAAQGQSYNANPVMSRALAAEDAMYRDLASERARDPRFLSDLGDVRDPATLTVAARKRRAQETADYDRRLEGSPFLGRLIGDVGYGLTDPVNYLPIGGPEAGAGVSVARRIGGALWQGARTNVAITAGTEPFVHADATAMGIDHGAAQIAEDLGGAAFAGALLSGGHAAGAELFGHVRARWQAAGTEADRLNVAAMEQTLPRANWTPDERAAAHVLNRTSDIAESSPFVPGGAGDGHHAAQLDTAYRAATADQIVPRDTPPLPDGVAAVEQVKAHIRRAESRADTDTNDRSTASGRYQFTLPTWLSYYKRRYGAGGLDNTAIWAKRFDPDLQEVLMSDLLADNRARLRAAGHAETPANLYMLHFLGPDGLKVLAADAATPLEQLLPARDFKSNKFLSGKTAGWLAAWADRKMGGKGEARLAAGEAPRAPPEETAAAEEPFPDLREEPRDFTAERDGLADGDLPNLRAELFGTPEGHAAAQLAVWREAMPAPEAIAARPATAPAAAPPLDMRAPERAPMRRSGPVDLMQAIADAGGIRDDEGHDLLKGRGVPRFVRGAGVIVHDRGRSIDAMGEHLWEQGWFGPPSTSPRPREAQVLDMIDRAVRQRVFRPDDVAEMEARAAARRAMPEEEARFELTEHARDNGIELDPRTLEAALDHRANGETVEGAVARAVHEAGYRDAEPPAGLERFDDPDGEGVQAQIDSLEHDLRMAALTEDTRGKGVFYHGARGAVPKLSEGYYNPDNIYGGMETFYTTDAADIAKGYGRKRASARIYSVTEREPVKFFDMEERHPAAVFETLFHVGEDDSGLVPMAIEEAAQEHGGAPNLREVMDEIRSSSGSEGVSKDEVQEIFDTAITNLREQGFGAMTHAGGLKTGREPHTVRIYFDAPHQLNLHDMGPVNPEATAQLVKTPEVMHDSTYRLADEGPETTISDVLADAEDDTRAVEALRACMAPMGVAAE